jgi:hypothetical protein
MEQLVLQSEKPEVIQLAFDIVFWWKIEFDKISSHTPILQGFSALQSKKDSQKIWKSSLNRKWWVANSEYQTIYDYIVKMIDIIDKWQYVIEWIEL